jgi:putative lipase involved disintegration of autophagic bodies
MFGLEKLSIRGKLYAKNGTVIVLFLLISGLGIFGVSTLKNYLDEINNTLLPSIRYSCSKD